jgi:hypothetical protein
MNELLDDREKITVLELDADSITVLDEELVEADSTIVLCDDDGVLLDEL